MHATDDLHARTASMVARAAAAGTGSAARSSPVAKALCETKPADHVHHEITAPPSSFPEQMARWASLHLPDPTITDSIIAHVAALAKADASLARSLRAMAEDDGA